MCAKKRKGLSDADKAAARLVALYEKAERDIAARITRTMAATDGDKNKLTIRALEQQHKAIKKILKQLLAKTKKPVNEIVNNTFNGGLAVARKELKGAGMTDIVLEMGGINTRTMKVYSEQVYNRMADVVQQANRTTSDIYQALKMNTALTGAIGGYDAIGNVRRNMQKVSEDAGITAFIDKRGRSWNMASYTDMLCRTSSMQIFHQAKTNEYLAHGEDLVIVSSHYPTCDKCAPWNGKVLSLTGETPGYPTMEEAKAAGLFHPNCRHTYGLYIPDDGAGNNQQPEFNNSTSAEFAESLKTAKGNVEALKPEIAWRVAAHTKEEFEGDYPGAALHVTEGGSTVAITADGDIISVCKNPSDRVRGSDLLKLAVDNGGVKLDSYSGNHEFYINNGFEPVSWCRWSDDYASDDWKRANNIKDGDNSWRQKSNAELHVKKENIIFYKYTGKKSKYLEPGDFENAVPAAKDYDAAKAERDKSIE